MKIVLLAAVLALPAGCAAQSSPASSPAPTGPRPETCVDTVAGSPAMSVEVMRETEQRYWPDLEAREQYRLTMLVERLGAHMREGHAFPTTVDEFAVRVPEVPWLSTCDPWGHRVRISRQEREFELRSAGKDGLFGTADDLVMNGLLPTPRGPGGQ